MLASRVGLDRSWRCRTDGEEMKSEYQMEAKSKTERIVASARELFLLNGFEKTTMEEIAKAVPMSKATLYAEFPNKEEILLAICERHFERLQNMMLSISLATTFDYLGGLRKMLMQFVCSVYSESSSVRTPEAMIYINGRVKNRFHHRFTEIKKHIQCILDKAIEVGEISGITDSAAMCEVIVSMLTSYLPPYERNLRAPPVERPDKEKFCEEVEILLNLLLMGLKEYGKT